MIKFLHFNKHHSPKLLFSQKLFKKFQNRTVAVEPASADAIRALAKDFVSTHPTDQMLIHVLRVGVALLHPIDRYSKKTGRDAATAKLADVPLRVVGVVMTPTHIFIRLETLQGVDLNLRLNRTTGFSTVTGSMSGDK
jgi:hypothetical protein